jgi:cysteinyl-tRNA synthetase
MAKSLGNFITIKDFMDKYKDADILKLFFLSTHYSHPVDFTDKKIKDARKNKERIIEFMNNIYSETGKNLKASLKYDDFILRAKDRFINTMDNDFNMPRAFSCIFDLIKDTYEYMKKNKSKHSPNYVGIIKGVEYCCSDWLRNIFSLESVSSDSVTESIESGRRLWQFIGNDDLSYEEQILIENRAEARNRKDFVESDKIRIELKERNIVAKDTKEGSIYQRKS